MSIADPLHVIGAFERDLVVQAGAGTGKTHALVTLYLHLVTGLSTRREAIAPARILVITFTEKAAGELRERIAARIAALAEGGLAAEPTLAVVGRALPPAAELRRILAELPRAHIGTFHAFGQSLLRRHALAAGIDPGFSLIDEPEARARALDAARAALLAALADGDEGTAALVDAIGFGGRDGNGLVEALAGLRAARAEEGRTADGLAQAYAPERIARLRVEAIAPLREALASFAALEGSVGGKSAPRLQTLARAATAPELDDDRCTAFLALLRGEVSALRAGKDGGEALRVVKDAYHAAAERLLDAEATRLAAPRAQAIERLVADTELRYAAWKRGAGVVDFSDLIRLPRDLLRSRPAIASDEAARFDAILVDEFQDTNAAQADLVAAIAEAERERHGRRFVVGDRKQSIYEFRGADVGVFTEVTAALRSGGAGEVLLRRSFRSTPRVVAACNLLFANAFGQTAPAASWALSFSPERDGLVATREDVADAGAELLRVAPRDHVKRPARVLRRLEARAIAARMRALLDAGRRPGELALLLRRYTHLPTYLDALRTLAIPHYVVRGRGFYEAQEIRDLASLLLLLCDADDRLALVSVLRSPLCGLSDEGLAALAVERELDGALRVGRAALDEGDRDRLATLALRIDELRARLAYLGPAELLREIVARFDLRAILAGSPEGLQRIVNLDQLIARAAELGRDPRGLVADLPSFVRWLGRAVRPLAALDAPGAQILDERDDVVRVMTIHQAKGLQFPIVFVADCGAREQAPRGPIYYDAREGVGLKIPGEEAGELVHTTPSRRVARVRTERQHAESLRLFYVAATRAQDRVIFSGERTDGQPSWRRFLDELADAPGGALEVVDAPTDAPAPWIAPRAPALAVDLDALPAWTPLRPTRARALRVAVTQLQDFALCARRYHLLHELRLEETRGVRPEELELDPARPEADALRAGTLAHRLLERCTLSLGADAAREELSALLREEGYDPDEPTVRELAAHVYGFLATDFARSLGASRLRRELPFALALPAAVGEARLLRGQIDLLVLDEGGVTVVDYKHARGGDLERYRFQLEAYALAAHALYPRAPSLRVGLAFLRDADPSPRWLELGPLAAVEARMSEIAERLVRARLEGERSPIARASCEAIGCGFVGWCHGASLGQVA